MSEELSSHVGILPKDRYTDEQKKLVNSTLYSFVCSQTIQEMVHYADEHGLFDVDEDGEALGEIPESVFRKGRIRNIAGFIKICISDALYNNPYKVVPTVYLICAGALVGSIAVKIFVVCHKVERSRFIDVSDSSKSKPDFRKNVASLHESIWDTTASVMPIVVTLVLFLFPPLIANMM